MNKKWILLLAYVKCLVSGILALTQQNIGAQFIFNIIFITVILN